MPYLYIYSPDDFVTAPPDESGSAAAGTPNFTLQLKIGATPTLVEVTDDDAVLDEVDASQVLTNAIDLDGTNYAAGTTINAAYDLINTTTGHKVTSFHFGGDGYQQGAVDGIVSTVLMVPGQSYTFNTERTSHQKNNQYTDYVACFVDSTPIETPNGPVPAGQLKEGDLVITLDHGLQPLRGVLSQTVAAIGAKAPIVFPAGALNNAEQIIVSQQHRMLMSGACAEMLFGESQVLVPAVFLAEHGLGYRRSGGTVQYMHLVFDAHEIVFSAGCASESFLPSDQGHLPPAVRGELLDIFDNQIMPEQAARKCLRRHEALALVG